ncbi:PhzF family phenazine biosynthesis protein [Sungkyunkwania multivorans]|uniref:PhzF family phenazine biosynthesis protein n=1 Tax=Sungkyunkwania multivorans TaxID=1173618 RepID=A0ABW3D180_9FLAO
MTIPIYQIDAFASKVFTGNYAAVCPLRRWLKDELLLGIAKENNLPETAFIVQEGRGFHIRWFTPDIEMDLCGHATLASAHVIFNHLQYDKDEILFESSSGMLKAFKDEKYIWLDFPSRMPKKTAPVAIMEQGMDRPPKETFKARDYVLVYEHEDDIIDLRPDKQILDQLNLDPGGIIVTAPGKEVDFVSRFFTPQSTIFEDPVTGSAHCSLIPFWAERLQKTKMSAKQLSEREGTLACQLKGDRVLIGGKCVTYLKGEIYI